MTAKSLLRSPVLLLALLALASLGSRTLWLSNPREPIFDENYYVNAARTILGRPVPPGAPYADSPKGVDPNREQPPLGKLFIAAGIKAFGDGPVGWRMASLAFGTAAMLAFYALVRAAGGTQWLALGAAGIMAVDNLFLVHGRIGTLDIFVVTFMIGGAALYLRDRPILAGTAFAFGACTKLFGLLSLGVLLALELLRTVWPTSSSPEERGPPLRNRLAVLGMCAATTAIAYLAVLNVLDAEFTSFSNPVAHTRYMVSYASELTPLNPDIGSPSADYQLAPTSPPWRWLVNKEPIVYYRNVAAPPGQPGNNRALVDFEGRMNPFVIWLALPALGLAAYRARREQDDASLLVVAWCAGTFLPFVVLTLNYRDTYIYYMLVVLPGVYLGVAKLFSGRRVPRVLRSLYVCAAGTGFALLYPFKTWGGT